MLRSPIEHAHITNICFNMSHLGGNSPGSHKKIKRLAHAIIHTTVVYHGTFQVIVSQST